MKKFLFLIISIYSLILSILTFSFLFTNFSGYSDSISIFLIARNNNVLGVIFSFCIYALLISSLVLFILFLIFNKNKYDWITILPYIFAILAATLYGRFYPAIRIIDGTLCSNFFELYHYSNMYTLFKLILMRYISALGVYYFVKTIFCLKNKIKITILERIVKIILIVLSTPLLFCEVHSFNSWTLYFLMEPSVDFDIYLDSIFVIALVLSTILYLRRKNIAVGGV